MDNLSLIREKWPDIMNRIKAENDLTDVSYSTWIAPLVPSYADQEGLTLYVPMGNMAINILNKRYTLALRSALSKETGLNLRIHYTDHEEGEESSSPSQEEETEWNDAMDKAHLNPRYTFESFVVGSNSKFAHAASLAVAESPGEFYNPLYLYAGVGLGKTHLMHSIAHFVLKNNPEARVMYVTSEDFTNELIDSIRNGNNMAMSRFRDKYRHVDVLLIDDIQFIMGKESTQEEFFHTFEALYNAKKQIVVSSDKPPKDLNILEERIRSRLEMGLIADISSPDYETRMAILRKKMEIDGYTLDNEILDYIATNIHSNIRELEGCLNRIRAKSILEKSEVNLAYAQEILEDMITPEKEKKITSDSIMKVVADHFGLTIQELCSPKRDKKYVHPRMIAMYLCREMTEDAYSTIAAAFNKKDHTTVLSAHGRIQDELNTNRQTRNTVETLKKKIAPG